MNDVAERQKAYQTQVLVLPLWLSYLLFQDLGLLICETRITLIPNPQTSMSGDPTSLAPHERLTDLAVVPREKPHPGAAAREPPRDSPVIAEMRAFVSCMA